MKILNVSLFKFLIRPMCDFSTKFLHLLLYILYTQKMTRETELSYILKSYLPTYSSH